jgi:hypothetical protein
MRALHRRSALKVRNPALGALNQNLESTAIHGGYLRRTVFLTLCLLLRPRHPKYSSRWITIPTNLSLTPEFAAYRSQLVSPYFSAGQRVLSRGEQRPAEPRALLDGEQRLTDPSTRIALGGICSCCVVGSVPAHTLEVVDSGNSNNAYTISPGGYFIWPAKRLRASGPILEGGPGSQNRPSLLGTECDQNIDWKQQAINFCQVEFMI